MVRARERMVRAVKTQNGVGHGWVSIIKAARSGPR
jgi:hypothetical protein